MSNGMTSIRMHRSEAGIDAAVETAAPSSNTDLPQLAPESAARRYIDAVMGSGPNTIATEPTMNEEAAEYKALGVDKIPFLDHQYVKFRQYFHKIPVYGSLVTVELDRQNAFVSINTNVGDPSNVDPLATISPKDVIGKLAVHLGTEMKTESPARLFFYYDDKEKRWRLTYIIEDVLVERADDAAAGQSELGALPKVSDFVFDAHNGEFVAELPRTQTMASLDQSGAATDATGLARNISFVLDDATNVKNLHDRTRNIRTHDFKFRDAWFKRTSLPGSPVESDMTTAWDASAVSAHANAQEVVNFLRDVLQRNGLDGAGGEIVSSVNCVFRSDGTSKEWRNAARFRGQMIYGQRQVNGSLRSYAAALDIVAHELLHALTENTARLEYRLESGALNESLSDIFGIVVANRGRNIATWNWAIGGSLSDTGQPIRDMRDPARFGQPAHMDGYLTLPDTQAGDYGGVHDNSGIHNKAAYNVFNATSAAGEFLFTEEDVPRLYYVTLVAHLSRTSGFGDCRAGVILAAQSLFADTPTASAKIDAIRKAYDDVGIVDPTLTA